ncbi:transposase [Paractinoplanes toevensis]|uniref:Transposase n=1 Tax=Paractinoplanes toevensis TaxID=571911 RepID=A0A919TF82_9ACTN|nr:transposase [Actinoplanes toevensis]
MKQLCQILNIARSSFYYWKATATSRAARDTADAALAARIEAVRTAHDGTYGAPRITAELHDTGMRVNRKKVARVMRRYRIQGLRLRRRVQTTIADPAAAKAPDLIGRDFTAPQVNQRYVGDITYLPVGERGSFTCNGYRPALTTVGRVGDRRSHAHRTRRGRPRRRRTDPGQPRRGHLPQRSRSPIHLEGVRGRLRSGWGPAIDEQGRQFRRQRPGGVVQRDLQRETLQGRRAFSDEREARLSSFRWLHRYNSIRRHSRLGQRSPNAYENSIRTTPATLAQAA